MVGEGASIDLLTEACLLGLCFERLNLIAQALVALFVFPFGFWWQWFTNVWPAAEFEAEFCGGEALATGGLLLLRQILCSVAKAAGVIAVVAVQSDSTASAAPTDEYSTTFAEMCGNPLDAEALNVAVTAHDFEAGGGKPRSEERRVGKEWRSGWSEGG